MKTVILAGGLGTRLSEETTSKPKPMVEIGGHPMLWHIMNLYAAAGFTEFLIACGYRADAIKVFFSEFFLRNSDVFVDLATGKVESSTNQSPNWRVGCIDTGLNTMTGGRLKALRSHLGNESFMVTYGDGVADIDIAQLVDFHQSHGKLATVTAVRPPARFGGMTLVGDQVSVFAEKSPTQVGWINGGFFVFEPGVLDYIEGSETRLEAEPLSQLAADGELVAYKHDSFWMPMDTLREKTELERLWTTDSPPWKLWQ
jgi:glucose-1-phosphate cytidylyltransferase